MRELKGHASSEMTDECTGANADARVQAAEPMGEHWGAW
jgi:hypothetical protein